LKEEEEEEEEGARPEGERGGREDDDDLVNVTVHQYSIKMCIIHLLTEILFKHSRMNHLQDKHFTYR
jgi:hypothetical protein